MDSTQRLKSVIIIGGGLGGLVLGHLLKNSHLQVTICERDIDATARLQGFQIGINQEGLSVLRSLNLNGVDRIVASPDVSGFAILDEYLRLLLVVGEELDNGLVNRWKIREALAEGLEIQWNKHFTNYKEEDDRVIAYFEDGSSISADVLIGADGAKSRVRNQRAPSFVPRDIEITGTGAQVRFPPQSDIPNLWKHANKHFVRIVGRRGHTALVMRFKDEQEQDSLVWAFSHYNSIEKEPYPTDREEVKKMVIERAKAFPTPDFARLVELTPAENLLPPYPMRTCVPLSGNPLGATTRVTLLGDAAHPMTTHAGLGANTAFLDARDLAKALLAEDWKKSLQQYEKLLYERGIKAATISLHNTHMIHAATPWKTFARDWALWSVGWAMVVVKSLMWPIRKLKRRS